MRLSFWKLLAIINIVSAWSIQALADKVITLEEGKELVQQLAGALGLPVEWKVGDTRE